MIATGSDTNYYGNKNIEKYSMPMKTIPEALDLRSLILQSLEAALLTNDLDERYRLMNYVIVGGGPTGVELAGAMAELKKHVLPSDYPDLDIRRMNVHLIQASDRLLPSMSQNASEKALKYLDQLGVQVWFNTMVEDYDGKIITTSTRPFDATTMIWAAGVKGSLIPGIEGEEVIAGGRYIVNEFNQVKGFENIFAIGDIAYMETPKYPAGHPQVANVAINQGKNLARNILQKSEGKWKEYEYKDQGSMATIGKHRAVVDLPGIKFQGFLAWFFWMFLHLMLILSVRNKLAIFFNWMWSYINRDSSLRLIIIPNKKNDTVQ